MRTFIVATLLVGLISLCGCGGDGDRRTPAPEYALKPRAEDARLVDDPVAAVKAALPEGWQFVKVIENAMPDYHNPDDTGTLILFARTKDLEDKRPRGCGGPEHGLYIMPPDSGTADGPPFNPSFHFEQGVCDSCQAPPYIIYSGKAVRIYLDGDAPPDWNMHDDLLDALLE